MGDRTARGSRGRGGHEGGRSSKQAPRPPPAKQFGPAKMEQANFTEAGQHDANLKVSGGDLYCDKAILVMWSPYFRRIFSSKENKDSKVVEVDITHIDMAQMEEMLHIVYPPNKPIDDNNVNFALELSGEFEMTEVSRRCEQFLMNSEDITVNHLLQGQKYSLPSLIKKSIDALKSKSLETWTQSPEYEDIDDARKSALLWERIRYIGNKSEQTERKSDRAKEQGKQMGNLFNEIRAIINEEGIECKYSRQTVIDICDDGMDVAQDIALKRKDSKINKPFRKPTIHYPVPKQKSQNKIQPVSEKSDKKEKGRGTKEQPPGRKNSKSNNTSGQNSRQSSRNASKESSMVKENSTDRQDNDQKDDDGAENKEDQTDEISEEQTDSQT